MGIELIRRRITCVIVAAIALSSSYPASVDGEANFTVQWEISGGTSGDISHTSVHWGFSSAKISNYTRESKVQTGKTLQIFSADLYSNEYQISINPRYTGGGGGGGY